MTSPNNYLVSTFASNAQFILHNMGIKSKRLEINVIQRGRNPITVQDKVFVDQRLSSWECVKQGLTRSRALIYWLEN